MRLEAGRSYRVRIDAHESYGEAQLELVWAPPTASLEAEAVRAAQQADAVVMFLGLTARLEGEEMPVQIAGFRGGDRTAHRSARRRSSGCSSASSRSASRRCSCCSTAARSR